MGEPAAGDGGGGRGQSSRGGSWGRGRPWERGGRRTTNLDGDIPMKQDTTAVLLVSTHTHHSHTHTHTHREMFMSVSVCRCPQQACLGQRYDVNTKSLDLSSMYHDPSESCVCVLSPLL